MSTILEVRGLTVRLGGVSILRDLSFAVAEGDSLAIIGPSGAGKTVLFRALIGAVPHEGTLRWAPGVRVGYVPQKLDIERDLPLTGHDLLNAKRHVALAPREDIFRAVDLVGLDRVVIDAPIGTLSGGQFQRLLLALAFVGRPGVLLFDEPTAGVDEPGEELLYETIARVKREAGLTLLLISHELSLVYRYATAVLCLGRGRAWLGPPTEALTPARLEELYGTPLKYHVHR
jgi:zinc transport system ATP-binding protein